MHKLLIVEDVYVLRQSLAEMIKMIAPSWTVQTAADGQRGYELAVELQPDLILTDHDMPVMSGKKMVKLIRKTPLVDKTPVAFMSSIDDDQTFRELIKEGDWCVQKPLGLKQIRSLLHSVEHGETLNLYPYYTPSPPTVSYG